MQANIRWMTIVTTLLIISGCASVGKQNERAKPVTSDQLKLSEGQSIEQPIQVSWWKQLNDPLLDNLMDKALTRSPDIQLALTQIQAAHVQAMATLAKAGPQIGAGMSLERQKYANYGYGLFPPPIAGSIMNLSTTAIKGNWKLDIWGEHWHELQANLGTQCAISLKAKQVQIMLSQAVIGYYIKWQTISQQQYILQQRINNTKSMLDLVRKRIRTGILSADNAYPLEQALATMQANALKLETENSAMRHALVTLTAQPITALDNQKPNMWKSIPDIQSNGVRADILSQRPDISAQYQLILAKYQMIQSAKALFLPSIQFEGMVGFSALKTRDLFDPLGKIFSITPSITMPIFRSGQLRANLKAQNIQYDIAITQYNKTVLEAIKQASNSLDDYHNSQKMYQVTMQATSAIQKQANAMKKRVHAGITNAVEWFKLKDKVLEQQMQQVNNYAKFKLAYSTVNTVFGGGFNASNVANICKHPISTPNKTVQVTTPDPKQERLPEKTITFS